MIGKKEKDASERYELNQYDTKEEAIEACKKIVDSFLATDYKPGMTAEKLYERYISFGEDPWIKRPEEEREMDNIFSAWDYAKERRSEICEK